jgi:hypothetical protein
MSGRHMPTLTPAEMLAALKANVSGEAHWDSEAYDGPEPDEAQMTGREMDMAADRYYGDAR